MHGVHRLDDFHAPNLHKHNMAKYCTSVSCGLESAAECNRDTSCQSPELEFHVRSSTLADGQTPL